MRTHAGTVSPTPATLSKGTFGRASREIGAVGALGPLNGRARLCHLGHFKYPPYAAIERLNDVACHCRDCHYLWGGAPAYAMIFRAEDVAVTSGAAREHWVSPPRGNRIVRMFCETCGTPLFAWNARHPEFLLVKAGSLDDPSQFRQQANIRPRPAQPWPCIDAAVPRLADDPKPDLSALPELVRSLLVRAAGFAAGCLRPGRR